MKRRKLLITVADTGHRALMPILVPLLASWLLISAILVPVYGQVSLGTTQDPQDFSILELVGNGAGGLRLPQLTTAERNALESSAAFIAEKTGKARGLRIFNMTTKCVDTWNGAKWISACAPYFNDTIPTGSGTPQWNTTKWVGAFWRNDQTGERVIASKYTGTWSVTVPDDPNSTLDEDVILEASGGTDPNLWTATPGEAENYQLTGNSQIISGTGNILFRVGLKRKNPNPATNADPVDGFGKQPRYAQLTLTVGGVAYTLFLRQGEAADYLFRPTDASTGTFTSSTRPLAAKFSPYNLTNVNIPDNPSGSNYLDVSVPTAVRGGVFVDYPTKAGAFWQWGTDISNGNAQNYIRRAFHPVNPPTGDIINWDSDNSYPASNDTWNEFTGANSLETCPTGWRRPSMGAINSTSTTLLATNSEIMHSLFLNTMDNSTRETHVAAGSNHYIGYYADGYFDRRPIVLGLGSDPSYAVSASNKNAAYQGILYTNPASNASLFLPSAGQRHAWNVDGPLFYAGADGTYWSRSAHNASNGWAFTFNINDTYQYFGSHAYGLCIRCVKE
jgi:hypothetical protein